MQLKDLSTEQLKDELARRKTIVLDKPAMIEDPDLTALKKLCQEYIDFVAGPDYNDDQASDIKAYVFDEAIETFFGKGVFQAWVNKHAE